jgi:hypothetical protein
MKLAKANIIRDNVPIIAGHPQIILIGIGKSMNRCRINPANNIPASTKSAIIRMFSAFSIKAFLIITLLIIR